MATRKELIETVGARYRSSTVAERSAILDEFVATTGYHRKHAIRLLAKPLAPPRKRRSAARYGPAVRDALTVLWEVGSGVFQASQGNGPGRAAGPGPAREDRR